MVASNEFNPDKITKGDVFTSTNVEDFPVPHGRDEVWRFVSLRKLRGLHNGEFAEAVAQEQAACESKNGTYTVQESYCTGTGYGLKANCQIQMY